MTNIVAVLIVRCRHTGVYADGRPNTGSVTLYDLDEITIQKNRTRYVPIPAGATVDIPMSTRTLVSWHHGDIDKLTRQGLLDSEIILQIRDKGNCGGPTGTGQSLRPAVLNAERVGGQLRLVLPDDIIPTNLDSLGFLVGEPVEISGLSGGFRGLDGSYTISAISPGTGLGGAAPGSYLISMLAPGPDIAAATLAGVNVCLSAGRVVTQFNGKGNVGGLGANVYAYIGGQLFPGATLSVENEGVVVDLSTSTMNFIGNGVSVTGTGPGDVDVNIPPESLFWGNQSVASNTTIRYLDTGYVSSIAPLAPLQYRVTHAGTMRNMRIRHNTPTGNGNAVTYTLRLNNVPTALSVSIASTATDGADLANTVLVNVGDLLDIEITKAAIIANGNVSAIAILEFGA